MSRHLFETTLPDGRPVRILCGWDRPLQGYFLSVRRTDIDEREVTEDDTDPSVLFDSLDRGVGYESTLDPYLDVLNAMSIQLPEEMTFALFVDSMFNAGNKEVHHFVSSGGIYACCEL